MSTTMTTTRILLADDHEVVRQGLRVLLEAQPGWEVVGEAQNGREAVDKVRNLKPDIVVLDVTMPELNGLEATRQILKSAPQTEVLVLTMHESEQVAARPGGRDLVSAVDALRHRRPFFTPRISQMVLEGFLHGPAIGDGTHTKRDLLTPREREIVQLLAEGKSNKEVATSLGISPKTIETHRANIMRKLNLHSVSELVRFAVRNRMVEP